MVAEDASDVLRLLVDRRDELGRARTETVSRIHHLLLEVIPGGAKKFLTRGQASYLHMVEPEAGRAMLAEIDTLERGAP